MSDDDKRQAYIDALKTNRCVDIMKAYYEWRGYPHERPWKDSADEPMEEICYEEND